MKFEDVLHQIGDEQRFQVWLIILLLLPTSFFNAFHDSVIQMAKPDHWCTVPQLAHLTPEVQHELIRPLDSQSEKGSSCLRYDIDYDRIRSVDEFISYLQSANVTDRSALPTVKCDESIGWTYDQSLYTETAVTWVSSSPISKLKLTHFFPIVQLCL